jgi:hypothetical protein
VSTLNSWSGTAAWLSGGAKSDLLAAFGADLVVVPECARSDAHAFAETHGLSFIWGDGRGGDAWQHKGLAVFARAGLQLALSGRYDPGIKVVLPAAVSGARNLNALG